MIVYVETNFVLELAWSQEEAAACDGILRLCESGGATLAIPSFCLAEPYETVLRSRKDRTDMVKLLTEERDELDRSDLYRSQVKPLDEVVGLLARISDEELERLDGVLVRITAIGKMLLPSPQAVGKRALLGEALAAKDAMICACVLSDLEICADAPRLFVTRDSHFTDPDVQKEFRRLHCHLLFSFTDAQRRLRHSQPQTR